MFESSVINSILHKSISKAKLNSYPSLADHSTFRAWISGYESTAPVAAIMGPREQSVASGSTITLRCVILSPYQTRPIRGVQWLRDNKLLTFQVTHTSSRETESNEIFFTSSLFFLSTINSRESLQRKKRDHKSSMPGRQPFVVYSTPSSSSFKHFSLRVSSFTFCPVERR